jgi:hypothetical protein
MGTKYYSTASGINNIDKDPLVTQFLSIVYHVCLIYLWDTQSKKFQHQYFRE